MVFLKYICQFALYNFAIPPCVVCQLELITAEWSGYRTTVPYFLSKNWNLPKSQSPQVTKIVFPRSKPKTKW